MSISEGGIVLIDWRKDMRIDDEYERVLIILK